MFFVAERAADIAQVRVMRIDLYDRTAGVAVRVVVGIGYGLAFVLTVTADTGVLSGPAARGSAFCGKPRSQPPCV